MSGRVSLKPRVDGGALTDLDIDELVDRLSSVDIQKLLDDCDPDDPHIPPSMRTSYKCTKEPTGPLDRKRLLDFINDQAINTPDVVDPVPFVPGTIRGRKYVAPVNKDVRDGKEEMSIQLDIDTNDDEYEVALDNADSKDIVDLAGILGLHSMMNQDQFHASQSEKWAHNVDNSLGLSGVTKATPLKPFPAEEPNKTDPEQVVRQLKSMDPGLTSVNLNNVPLTNDIAVNIFDALANNDVLVDLSMANCGLGDVAGNKLAAAIESNDSIEKLNIESNAIAPAVLATIFQALNVKQSVREMKASNQKAQFLGNKVEMAITESVERNKSILKVGLHFDFGDCRNRVAVQLQKNLDRVRLQRVAHKLNVKSNEGETTDARQQTGGTGSSRSGGYFGLLPGQLPPKLPMDNRDDDDEE